MLNHTLPVLVWFLNLFDPPPLQSMNWMQKIGRVLVVTVSLFLACVLVTMLSALIIFIVQRGWQMFHSSSHFFAGLVILVAGISVNTVCVMILVEISRADGRLMAGQGKD